jgi:transcriptional regulator with XRE-family HTH domain
METDEKWRKRLAAAVKDSGRSARDISLAAGLAHGYVHSLLGKEQKDPSVQNLQRVCDELGVSLSYIWFGFDMTPEAEEFLRHFEAASPERRRAMLALFRPPSS